MAQQRFEKGTELHQMINDYLRLLQQFWVVEESDYGKYFFDTEEEAEKFWEERYGE